MRIGRIGSGGSLIMDSAGGSGSSSGNAEPSTQQRPSKKNDGDLLSTISAFTLNSRSRTESENSDKQPKFMLPGVSGSPPKILTMDEVANVVKNIENMTLAHEIAINPEFKLQVYEPPENSMEKTIKEVMHKAFWDVLREQLERKPPCYDHAIQLLGDIKECFAHIVLKNNRKILTCIGEVLDEDLIRQQAVNGVLDFKAYTNFIIEIMSKICAPVRDDDIRKLYLIDDLITIFRQILETMSIMKLDMANCILDAARFDFISNSVEYEKKKFKEYLELYKYGFPETELWLHRHVPEDKSDPHWQKTTILNAYLEFLDWNTDNEFPEILSMDQDRLLALTGRSLRLCICASTLAIASGIGIIGQNSDNKTMLAQQIEIILQNVTNNNDLCETIENVWLQVKSVIEKELNKIQKTFPTETENAMKHQILQLTERNSAVRTLMWNRFIAYMRLVKTSKKVAPPPPGYIEFGVELQALAGTFHRLTVYNYSVFGEHYHEILDKGITAHTN